MDFNNTVDQLLGKNAYLFSRLAHRMGVSESRAYRFRMDTNKKSYIPPPANWQTAVLGVALEYLEEYRKFVLELQRQVNEKGR